MKGGIAPKQKRQQLRCLLLVGATGFEPATPCSRSKCATRLRYAPMLQNARIIWKGLGLVKVFAHHQNSI